VHGRGGKYTVDKIKTFRGTFRGREDVVPRYWISKDGMKSGYTPLCQNEWKKGVCQKPCRTCPNAVYIPLSDDLVMGHFKGRHILGVYPLLKNNTCCFVAVDLDNHSGDRNPLRDAIAYHEVCEVQEIPTYPLRSKSGNGYHVYTIFDSPVSAWKARTVAFALLSEAGLIGPDIELSSFDRLFPNQNELTGKGFGNLIGLPFQGQAAKEGHTLFLDPETGFRLSYKDQWAILESIERVSETRLDQIISDWNLKTAEPPKGSQKEKVDAENWFKNGIPEGRKHTDLFRYACQKITQGLAYDEVLILTTELAKRCRPLPQDGPEQAALDRVRQAFEKFGDPTNEVKKTKRPTIKFT